MLGLEWQCKKAAEATGNGKRLLVVREVVSFYQQKDIFVFVGETYAHSNPLLILVNLCEVSSIHFITMMDHHWGGSWGGGEHIYIYI